MFSYRNTFPLVNGSFKPSNNHEQVRFTSSVSHSGPTLDSLGTGCLHPVFFCLTGTDFGKCNVYSQLITVKVMFRLSFSELLYLNENLLIVLISVLCSQPVCGSLVSHSVVRTCLGSQQTQAWFATLWSVPSSVLNKHTVASESNHEPVI